MLTSVQRPEYPAWEDCPPSGDKGVEFRQRAEIRLVTGQEVFSERRANGTGEFHGWVAHRDGSDPDVIAMLMFADAGPPPVLTAFGPVSWVPTVELTVHVRRRPAPGWIQGQFETQDLGDGRMIESGMLWDSTGALVAQVRQIQLVLARD